MQQQNTSHNRNPSNLFEVNAHKRKRGLGPVDMSEGKTEEEQQVPYTDQKFHSITIDSRSLASGSQGMINNAFGAVTLRAVKCSQLAVEPVYANISTYLRNYNLDFEYQIGSGANNLHTINLLTDSFSPTPLGRMQARFLEENAVYNIGSPGWSARVGNNNLISMTPSNFDSVDGYWGIHWERHLAWTLLHSIKLNIDSSLNDVTVAFDKKALSLLISFAYPSGSAARTIKFKKSTGQITTPDSLFGWDGYDGDVPGVWDSGQSSVRFAFPHQPHAGTIPFVSLQTSSVPAKQLESVKTDQQIAAQPLIATVFLHQHYMSRTETQNDFPTVQLDHMTILPHNIQARLLMPNGNPVPSSMRWSCKLLFYE